MKPHACGDKQTKQGVLPPAKLQKGWPQSPSPTSVTRVGILELCQSHAAL